MWLANYHAIDVLLTYRHGSGAIHAFYGALEGNYIHKLRDTQRIKLTAAIEFRPQ